MVATDKVFAGSIPEFYDRYPVPLIFESYASDLATRIAGPPPRDVLEQAALFFPDWDREYALALIEAFCLPLNRRMNALSRGMLSAAGALVGLQDLLEVVVADVGVGADDDAVLELELHALYVDPRG